MPDTAPAEGYAPIAEPRPLPVNDPVAIADNQRAANENARDFLISEAHQTADRMARSVAAGEAPYEFDQTWEQAQARTREEFPHAQLNPLHAEEAYRQVRDNAYREQLLTGPKPDQDRYNAARYWTARLPFTGHISEFAANTQETAALQRIRDGGATQGDYLRLGQSMAYQQTMVGRTSNFQKAFDTLTAIPGFGVEMYAAAPIGLAARGWTAARLAGLTGVVGKAARGILPRAAQGFAMTLPMAANVTQGISERLVPDVQFLGDGRIAVGPDKSLALATWQAYLDTQTEIFTELAGGQLVRATGRFARMMPGSAKAQAATAGLARWWTRTAGQPGQMFNAALRQTGWHGVFGEFLEERLGEVARAGLAKVAGGDQADGGMIGAALSGRYQDALDQLYVEGMAFLAYGAGSTLAGNLARHAHRYGMPQGGPQIQSIPEMGDFQRGFTDRPGARDFITRRRAVEAQNAQNIAKWMMTAPLEELEQWKSVYPGVEPVIAARQRKETPDVAPAAQDIAAQAAREGFGEPIQPQVQPQTSQTANQAPQNQPQEDPQAAPGGVSPGNVQTSTENAPQTPVNAPAPGPQAPKPPVPPLIVAIQAGQATYTNAMGQKFPILGLTPDGKRLRIQGAKGTVFNAPLKGNEGRISSGRLGPMTSGVNEALPGVPGYQAVEKPVQPSNEEIPQTPSNTPTQPSVAEIPQHSQEAPNVPPPAAADPALQPEIQSVHQSAEAAGVEPEQVQRDIATTLQRADADFAAERGEGTSGGSEQTSEVEPDFNDQKPVLTGGIPTKLFENLIEHFRNNNKFAIQEFFGLLKDVVKGSTDIVDVAKLREEVAKNLKLSKGETVKYDTPSLQGQDLDIMAEAVRTIKEGMAINITAELAKLKEKNVPPHKIKEAKKHLETRKRDLMNPYRLPSGKQAGRDLINNLRQQLGLAPRVTLVGGLQSQQAGMQRKNHIRQEIIDELANVFGGADQDAAAIRANAEAQGLSQGLRDGVLAAVAQARSESQAFGDEAERPEPGTKEYELAQESWVRWKQGELFDHGKKIIKKARKVAPESKQQQGGLARAREAVDTGTSLFEDVGPQGPTTKVGPRPGTPASLFPAPGEKTSVANLQKLMAYEQQSGRSWMDRAIAAILGVSGTEQSAAQVFQALREKAQQEDLGRGHEPGTAYGIAWSIVEDALNKMAEQHDEGGMPLEQFKMLLQRAKAISDKITPVDVRAMVGTSEEIPQTLDSLSSPEDHIRPLTKSQITINKPLLFQAKINVGGKTWTFNAVRSVEEDTDIDMISEDEDADWELSFRDADRRLESTGEVGSKSVAVISGIGSAFDAFLQHHDPLTFHFSADAKEQSRVKLYERFSQFIARQYGYKYNREDHSLYTLYSFVRGELTAAADSLSSRERANGGLTRPKAGLKDTRGLRQIAEQITKNTDDVVKLGENISKATPALAKLIGDKEARALMRWLWDKAAWHVMVQGPMAADKVEDILLQHLRGQAPTLESLQSGERVERRSPERRLNDLIELVRKDWDTDSDSSLYRSALLAERLFPGTHLDVLEAIDEGVMNEDSTADIAEKVKNLASKPIESLGNTSKTANPESGEEIPQSPQKGFPTAFNLIALGYDLWKVPRVTDKLSRRKVNALANMKTGVVHTRSMHLGDEEIAMEELIHQVDRKMGIIWNQWKQEKPGAKYTFPNIPSSVAATLEALGYDFGDDHTERVAEGFQQILRSQIMGQAMPAGATEAAAWINQRLAQHPADKAKFDQLTRAFAEYNQLKSGPRGAIDVWKGNVSVTGQPAEPYNLTTTQSAMNFMKRVSDGFRDFWISKVSSLRDIEAEVDAARKKAGLKPLHPGERPSNVWLAGRHAIDTQAEMYKNQGVSAIIPSTGHREVISMSWEQVTAPFTGPQARLLERGPHGEIPEAEAFVVAKHVIYEADKVDAMTPAERDEAGARYPMGPKQIEQARAAMAVWENGDPADLQAMNKFAENMTNINNDILRAISLMGIVDIEKVEALIAKHPMYASLRRVIDMERRRASMGIKPDKPSTGIYALYGSGMEVQSPIKSLFARYGFLAALQQMQQVKMSLDNILDVGLLGKPGLPSAIHGLGHWAGRREAPTKTEKKDVPKERLLEALDKVTSAPGALDEIADLIGEELSLYFTTHTNAAGEPAFVVLRPNLETGKVEQKWYQVHSMRLHNLLTNAWDNFRPKGWVEAALRPLAIANKAGKLVAINLNPQFQASNPVRDIPTFILNTQNLKSIVELPKWWKIAFQMQWHLARGGKPEEFDNAIARMHHYMGSDYQKLAPFTPAGIEAQHRAATSAVGWQDRLGVLGSKASMWVKVFSALEMGPRLLEMKNFLEAEGITEKQLNDAWKNDPKRSPINAQMEVALQRAGANVTVDFSDMGYGVEVINQYFMLFGPTISGAVNFGRAALANRLRTAMTLGALCALEVLYLLHYKDEPWYNEQEPHLRYRYWLFPIRGQLWRVPKPQGLMNGTQALFQDGVRYLMNKDPQFMDGFKQLVGETLPPIQNPLWTEPLRVAMNQDFTGRRIVPKGEENAPNRFSEYQAPYLVNQATGGLFQGRQFHNPFVVQSTPNASVDRLFEQVASMEAARLQARRQGQPFAQEREYDRMSRAADQIRALSREMRGERRGSGGLTVKTERPSAERIAEIRQRQIDLARRAFGQ